MTTLIQVAEFIQKEASLLDDRNWDDWLELYHPQAEYWVPMWDDDGTPTTDPHSELSLIYYASRAGLEDRVFRIRTGKSSATTPMFRTCHIRSLPQLTHEDGLVAAAFNWVTHAYRSNTTLSYFGKKKLWLEPDGDSFKIRKAYTLIDNDLIDQVVDVYHL